MQTRHLVIGALVVHAIAIGAGGALLAAADAVAYSEGMWLAANTVTTIGFGPGPQTDAARLLMLLVFAMGAFGWWLLLLSALVASRSDVAASRRRSGSDVVDLGDRRSAR